jgi:glutathione synthase/RimK-type ligase-like ATP-grasp enzyme
MQTKIPMKKVLILIGRNDWKKSRPFETARYQYSYEFFYNLCKENGIQMFRASYQWYDYKKHIFKYAWVFEKSGNRWNRVKNVRPDLIYDKTKSRMEVYYKKELIKERYSFINDLDFTRIIDDKFITSLIFNRWSKPSWIVNSINDIPLFIDKIKTEKFILKPLSESGGKGIFILDKKSNLNLEPFQKTYLIQEFIDSTSGIKGLCKGMHDLRLVFINEKLIYSYIRQPRSGSFLANIAQGGSFKIVPKSKLPKSIGPIIEYANEVFSSFAPRVYTIDLMFDKKQRPWIIELNSMPGLYFSKEEKPCMIEMYRELLKIFKTKLSLLK